MKSRFPSGWILLLLLPLLWMGCQTAEPTTPSTTPSAVSGSDTKTLREITVLLEQWHRAIIDRDSATLDRIWADEYRSVNPTGQIVPKSDDMRLVEARDLVFQRLVVQNVQIPHQTRSTVVATSVTTASGVFQGQSFGGQFRNTVVFEKRIGGWKAVWGQSTEIPPVATP